VAVRMAAMSDLENKSQLLEPTHGSDCRATADGHEMADPVQTWVALPGATIETVNDRDRYPLFGTGQLVRQGDRLKGEREIKPLRQHVLLGLFGGSSQTPKNEPFARASWPNRNAA